MPHGIQTRTHAIREELLVETHTLIAGCQRLRTLIDISKCVCDARVQSGWCSQSAEQRVEQGKKPGRGNSPLLLRKNSAAD